MSEENIPRIETPAVIDGVAQLFEWSDWAHTNRRGALKASPEITLFIIKERKTALGWEMGGAFISDEDERSRTYHSIRHAKESAYEYYSKWIAKHVHDQSAALEQLRRACLVESTAQQVKINRLDSDISHLNDTVTCKDAEIGRLETKITSLEVRLRSKEGYASRMAASSQRYLERAVAAEAALLLQPIETAPKDGNEFLIQCTRAGIAKTWLVAHYIPGGHCIEDHPAIDEGFYFWTGSFFDKVQAPTGWLPIPAQPQKAPHA